MFTLLMDLGKQASKSIKAGVKAYKAANGDVSKGKLATVVLGEVRDWEPTINGQRVLTPGLRTSLAGALAHLAYNIAAADAGKELM